MVDSAVRRSNRVKANANGFKSTPCKSKKCLGCSANPPTLTTSMIRKIGTSLCHLQENRLDEQALLGKKRMEPVGKKLKKNREKSRRSQMKKKMGIPKMMKMQTSLGVKKTFAFVFVLSVACHHLLVCLCNEFSTLFCSFAIVTPMVVGLFWLRCMLIVAFGFLCLLFFLWLWVTERLGSFLSMRSFLTGLS